MSRLELEVWDDECSKVTFYTVREEGASVNETDKFFDKYSRMPDLKEPAQVLLSLVRDSIGEDHGAIDDFFNRPEDELTGLPPHGRVLGMHFPNFPLRLFALRPNNRDDIVILFGGGVKSARTVQESEDLNMRFLEAKSFAKRIEAALQDGTIEIDEGNRSLKMYDGSTEIIL